MHGGVSCSIPFIKECQTNANSCTPIVECQNTVNGGQFSGTCDQECKSRGFSSGGCLLGGLYPKLAFGRSMYEWPGVIGSSSDCPAPMGCECALKDQPYTGPLKDQFPYMYDNTCEAACHQKGYTFGECYVQALSPNLVCSEAGYTVYAGTTDVCKGTSTWGAGCCCSRTSKMDSSTMFNPNDTSPSSAAGNLGTKKANGASCAAGSECNSGYCSYTFCVTNSSYCGGITGSMNYANGEKASNQWLNGVCVNGKWNVVSGGIDRRVCSVPLRQRQLREYPISEPLRPYRV